MTAAADTPTTIEGREDLIADLESGCTHRSDWAIGTEHEKFAYTTDDLRPIPYEGRRGVKTLLEGLRDRFGWAPVTEDGVLVALGKQGCSVGLEPGGQIELSGAPLKDVHQTCAEVHRHLHEVKEICGDLGIGLLGVGHQPKWGRRDIPWMPKGR